VTYENNMSAAVIGGYGSCPGNSFGRDLLVAGDTGLLTIGSPGSGNGDAVAGNISVTRNALRSGTSTLTNNAAGGSCQLNGNKPGIVGTSNTAHGVNNCNRTA
jgi:hypothetical protein